MNTKLKPEKLYEQAMLDPSAVFNQPEDVLLWSGLSPQQKREILQRWEYDATEMETAEAEGMVGNAPSLLYRIRVQLKKIENSAAESEPSI